MGEQTRPPKRALGHRPLKPMRPSVSIYHDERKDLKNLLLTRGPLILGTHATASLVQHSRKKTHNGDKEDVKSDEAQDPPRITIHEFDRRHKGEDHSK